MSDTPETDVCWDDKECNILEHARRLERDRDEQARLLGMSAERECNLRGKLERERALADRLAEALRPLLIATWREKQPSKAELAFAAWKEARNE